MGLTNDDYLFFRQSFENAGKLSRIISFVNTTDDPRRALAYSGYGIDCGRILCCG